METHVRGRPVRRWKSTALEKCSLIGCNRSCTNRVFTIWSPAGRGTRSCTGRTIKLPALKQVVTSLDQVFFGLINDSGERAASYLNNGSSSHNASFGSDTGNLFIYVFPVGILSTDTFRVRVDDILDRFVFEALLISLEMTLKSTLLRSPTAARLISSCSSAGRDSIRCCASRFWGYRRRQPDAANVCFRWPLAGQGSHQCSRRRAQAWSLAARQKG